MSRARGARDRSDSTRGFRYPARGRSFRSRRAGEPMRGARAMAVLGAIAAATLCAASDVDTGVIRLATPSQGAPSSVTSDSGLPDQLSASRRGFDYQAFESRLQSLW